MRAEPVLLPLDMCGAAEGKVELLPWACTYSLEVGD